MHLAMHQPFCILEEIMYSKEEINKAKNLVEKSFKYYYNVAVDVFANKGLDEQFIKRCLANSDHVSMVKDIERAILSKKGLDDNYSNLVHDALRLFGADNYSGDSKTVIIADSISSILHKAGITEEDFEFIASSFSTLVDCIDVLWVSIYGECFSVNGYLQDTLPSVVQGKELLQNLSDMRVGWKVNDQKYIIQVSKTDGDKDSLKLFYNKWELRYNISAYLDLGKSIGFLFDFYMGFDGKGNPHIFMSKSGMCNGCEKYKSGNCKMVELSFAMHGAMCSKIDAIKFGRNTNCNSIPFATSENYDKYVYTIGISDILKLLQHVIYVKTNRTSLVKMPGGSNAVKQNVRASYKVAPIESNYVSANVIDTTISDKQEDIVFVNSYMHEVAERVVKPWQGGHHASPVPHERRSTFRRCKNGSYNYVNGKYIYVGKPNGDYVPVRGSFVNSTNQPLVVKNVKIK